MAIFHDANQARISLKMRLSVYSWYTSSAVVTGKDGYYVVVRVKYINDKVRRIIAPVVNGVSIKTESD